MRNVACLVWVACIGATCRAGPPEDVVVRGTVSDRVGKAVGGALVRISDPTTNTTLGTTRTDPTGAFSARLPGTRLAGRGNAYAPVLVRVTKRSCSTRELVVGLARKTVAVVLLDSEPVFGVVRGPDGHPRAGVTVVARSDASRNGVYQRTVKTSATGAFRFEDAARDVSAVTARGPRLRSATVRVIRNRLTSVQLQALPLRVVTGVVTDSKGNHAAGATIYGGPGESTRVGLDGRFRVELLSEAVHTPFSGTRPAMGYVTVVHAGHKPLAVPLDDGKPLLVSLESCAPIIVRVFASDGSPVRGALIELLVGSERPSSPVPFWQDLQETDSAGRVILASVPSGPLSIRTWIRGQGAVLRSLPREPEFTLRLRAPTRVTGRVLLDGKPVAGALVSGVSSRAATVVFGLSSRSTIGQTYTDTNGRFVLRLLAECAAEGVFASLDRRRSVETPIKAEVGDLGLEAKLDLVGRLTSSTGGPIASARVACRNSAGELTTLTDSDGRFVFEKQPVAAMSVIVSGPEFLHASVAAWPGDLVAMKVVRTHGPGTLLISVRGAEPDTVPEVTLVHARHHALRRTGVAVRGELRLDRLPVGRYSVKVSSMGFAITTTSIDIGSGKNDLTLELRRGPALRLLGVPGSRVRISTLSGRSVRRHVVLDERGYAAVHGFSSGEYWFEAFKTGYLLRTSQVRVKALSNDITVDLATSPAGTLRIKVIDRSGRPVAGARIRLRAGFVKVDAEVTTDKAGVALPKKFPGGRVTVEAESENADGEAEVHIRPGEDAVVTVVVDES